MVAGKPYRYGLIVAGLCVSAVGLFIMTQESPHIYATMCTLGVIMIIVGTVWSLCQCYPKVILAPAIEEVSLEELMCADAKNERRTEAQTAGVDPKWSSSALPPEVLKTQSHSCPTLNLH